MTAVLFSPSWGLSSAFMHVDSVAGWLAVCLSVSLSGGIFYIPCLYSHSHLQSYLSTYLTCLWIWVESVRWRVQRKEIQNWIK
ncbi:hypothetical protein B0T24DRAFT_156531 [Lasiosphaeria ovina]|uniref:Uncharacterized protein n=1 Tax=Lasiosphaeria ovina TaxID=92902 RepID=A0AAE0KN01_9PEZI|nr:hypothetical protein B0T24DRAFT_156531 [Lasiosphaeria ovina]